MKLSIIIPVYNGERYIKKCISSIISQEYRDYEIIVVEDGSKDNTAKIVKEIIDIEPRVKLFCKKNGGVSSARNYGINKANGEYIMFLDADDWLVDNCLKDIMNNISAELTIYNYNIYNGTSIILNKDRYNDIKGTNGIEILENIRKSNNEIPKSSCRIIARRDFIDKNNIRFNMSYTFAEDFDFVLNCIIKAQTIILSDNPIFNYNVVNVSSATKNIKYIDIYSQLEVYYKYFNMFKNNNGLLSIYFANLYINIVYTIFKLNDKEDIKNIINYIKNKREILKHSKGTKYIVAKCIWKIFGYYNGSKILHSLNKLRGK